MAGSFHLFVAIFLPEEVRRQLAKIANSAVTISSLRWVPAESLHITLKFLGSVPEGQVKEISAALSVVSAEFAPFQIGLASGGAFPTPKRARVFWAGIAGEVEPLKALAAHVETALAALGFEPEKRKFAPHLTLAKPRSIISSQDEGMRFCRLFETYTSSMFNVDCIQLTQSHLSSRGSRYEILESYPLGSRT